VFVSLSRRQPLATSYELEDRAWRTGHGRLHAGFQRAATLEVQADIYRDLATTTDIDAHCYVPPGTSTDPLGDVPATVHTDMTDELAGYWVLLYEDGDDGSQNCALVARETKYGHYRGVWTYDHTLVAAAFDALDV